MEHCYAILDRMARPRVHDAALHGRLLQTAAHLVAENGAGSVSMRRLASAAGTSTTAVYSLFGGRPALFAALHAAAFADFGAAQHTAPISDEPAQDLMALAHAYRDWALSHPQLYAVMFAGALGNHLPPDLDPQLALDTMRPLENASARFIASGRAVPDASTARLSIALWSAVHGFVSLELLQFLDPDATAGRQSYTWAMSALLRGWTAQPGPVP